jgi:drug/metabolite transporter (DMT)-like permease
MSLFTNLSQGDVLIVMAALAYTFHCIRLERYAKETSAIKLAACKATTETVWSLALVLLLVAFAASSTAVDDSGGMLAYAFQEGTNIAEYVSTMFNQVSSGNLSLSTLAPAITAILWTGLVTCAYTIYAQSFGQSRVNPTDANLIYTIQPLCTALFAWVLLGESLGPAGYIGGALIGSAVLIVATSDDETNNRDDNDTFESLEYVNGDAAPVSMVHSPAEVEMK